MLRVMLAAGALALSAAAAAPQPIPPFGARVTDLTGTLTAPQAQTLTDQLAALEQRKGSRVAVLIVASSGDESIEQYSIRVTDAWKLSRTDKRTQDGVLLLVAKDDHHVRIEVGRDLEGAITDAAASRIIREYVTPKFRAGDFYGGIHDALDALTKLIDGENLPAPLNDDSTQGQHDPLGGIGLGVFLLIWARGFFSWLPSAPRAVLVGGATGAAAWFFSGLLPLAIGLGLLGLLVGWIGGSGGSFINRGGWGNGGFGGGSWGGGGGGGWSGGGGSSGGGGFSGGSSGGFSGGGASGSW